jgi:ethanolamine permease
MFDLVSNGIAKYHNVSNRYLKRRQLQGQSNSILLWGLGVGAVISGDFYGWNYGLAAGGFWGLAIATSLMAIMYLCIVYSLAEMSATLPHAGGLYSFTRSAFGPLWGMICGVVVTMEYILATAALVSAMSNYVNSLFPNIAPGIVWILAYAMFLAINIKSLELTLNVSLWLTIAAIMMLVVFSAAILLLGGFNLDSLFNIPADPGESATWLPKGWNGVFGAIPFGIWFYLAIEILPLAAEETDRPGVNIPKGLILGMFTLIALSLFTLVLNTGIGGGAVDISKSTVPLGDGLSAFFGKDELVVDIAKIIALLCGLGASLPTQIYGYGRIIFALSRAGYLPRSLSVTNSNQMPYKALILGTVLGFISVLLISFGTSVALDKVLLNMSVFGAVISYILVMFSYIKLKLNYPHLPRPYQSPLGMAGAVVGVGLAIFALIACMSLRDYQPGIVGVAIILVLAVLYFFLYSKNQLVAQAPEEITALVKLSRKQLSNKSMSS